MKDITDFERQGIAEETTFRLETIADELEGVEGMEDIRQMVLDTIAESKAIEKEFRRAADQEWAENEAWLNRQYERVAFAL